MKDEERRLDGNAAGGLLGEVFTFEMIRIEEEAWSRPALTTSKTDGKENLMLASRTE